MKQKVFVFLPSAFKQPLRRQAGIVFQGMYSSNDFPFIRICKEENYAKTTRTGSFTPYWIDI